jgi:hypothetical protein
MAEVVNEFLDLVLVSKVVRHKALVPHGIAAPTGGTFRQVLNSQL